MIVLTKEPITLSDTATYEEIEDAKLTADRKGWQRHDYQTTEERKEKIDLTNKCGSCSYFRFSPMSCCGGCNAGHPYGKRTRPACKDYRRKE